MKDSRAYNREYADILREKDYYQDYLKAQENIRNSTAYYDGEPVDFEYMPKMYTVDDYAQMCKATSEVYDVLTTVIAQYQKDAAFRALMNFDKRIEELMLVSSLYDNLLPMCRIDFFYDEDNGAYKLCEINTDGSSGMNEDRELVNMMKQTEAYKQFSLHCNLDDFELFESWAEAFLTLYRQYKSGLPNVAIVDFLDDDGPPVEFLPFQRAFEKKGMETVICDVRELEYRENSLFKGGFRIDAIYRRLVTGDVERRYDEVPVGFIQACLKNEVCLIGNFATQAVHNKKLFEIVHGEYAKQFLSAAQLAAAKKYFPYTKVFSPQDDIEEFIETKDKWILKPLDFYASKDVYAGREKDVDTWRKMLITAREQGQLIQEYVRPYQVGFPAYDNNGRLDFKDYNIISGIYMYAGRPSGLFTRIGPNAVISSINGGKTQPSFLVSEKE